ncbi:MAG TPA: OB-fold domain-containing protein [Dehalococcoidia bacterium]|nr:OB-fold domain-containing protein [Dehalococcoidia bacterium]
MNETDYKKPMPVPDEASRPFFEGMRKHQLVLMRCGSCRRWRLPAAQRCPECWSLEYAWEEASGRGRVYTFALMHHVLHPGFADEAPYNVTVVQLDEGPRYQTNLVGVGNDEIRVGMPVAATYEDINNEVSLLKFRPA